MKKILSLACLLLVIWCGTAFAGQNQSQGKGDAALVQTLPQSQAAAEARQFWTKERLAEALAHPKDIALEGTGQLLRVPSPQAADQPVPYTVPANCPDCSTASYQPPSGQVQPLSCPASGYMTWANTCGSVYPMRVVGKLFFSEPGGTYVCSASLVNGRMILTAGHCVCDGEGNWYDNWIFIPAYLNGAEPYGRGNWTYVRLKTAYFEGGDYRYDYAFILLDSWLGSSLGWLGLAFNMLTATQVYAQYGYPAASPYDGSTLYINTALVGAYDYSWGSPPTIGMGSSFTGGSSGGPWIIGDSYANSVTSYHYTSCTNTLYGPYFNDTTHDLYDNTYALQ